MKLFLSITKGAIEDINSFKRNPNGGSKTNYEDSIWFFKKEYDRWLNLLDLEDDHKYRELKETILSTPLLVNRKPRKPYTHRGPARKVICQNPYKDCGKEFESFAPNAKYCPACVDEVKARENKIASKKYRELNPDYIREYMRTYGEKRRRTA